MLRLFVPLLLIVTALAASIALDHAPPRADLTFVNRSEVFTLDPQRMSWLQDFRIAYCLYEGLVRWDNRDFSIQPAAAASHEISDDGLVYTFHLRPDARWSNGDPVTAHDFTFTWMRALLPETAADYTGMFFAIEGGEAFFNWRRNQLAAFSSNPATTPESLWEQTEQRFRDTVGLRALDDHTLQVTLARPVPYFLDLLAFPVFYPVHRPTVEGWPRDDSTRVALRQRGWHAMPQPPWPQRRWASLDPDSGGLHQRHDWTKPGYIACNGPYLLADWRYKRGLRLARNPHYHSPQIARSESIASVSIDEPNTAVLAFETGGIDWLSDVSVDYQADMLAQRERYLKNHKPSIDAMLAQEVSLDESLAASPPPSADERRNIHVFPTFGTEFFSFNCRPVLHDGRANVFADARIRRAFVLSADREVLVRDVTRLHEPVASTIIPVNSIPNYPSPRGLGHDPELARAELASAGWSDRDGDGLVENQAGELFPIVDVLYASNNPRYQNLALALRDTWQRELGVRVELRGKESKFAKEDLIHGNFMIGRGNWFGDYGDPTTFLDIFRTSDGNNDRGYSNPRVDGLLDQAAAERDPARRMAILSECERFLFQEEVPMFITCQMVQLYMYEPGKLTGLTTHPRLVQYLWQMQVNK